MRNVVSNSAQSVPCPEEGSFPSFPTLPTLPGKLPHFLFAPNFCGAFATDGGTGYQHASPSIIDTTEKAHQSRLTLAGIHLCLALSSHEPAPMPFQERLVECEIIVLLEHLLPVAASERITAYKTYIMIIIAEAIVGKPLPRFVYHF